MQLFNQYISKRAVAICVSEIALGYLAMVIGGLVWSARVTTLTKGLKSGQIALFQLAIVLLIQLSLHVGNCYSFGSKAEVKAELRGLFQYLTLPCLAIIAALSIIPNRTLVRGELITGTCILFFFTLILRIPIRTTISLGTKQRIAILGTSESAELVAQELCRRQDLGWEFIGFIAESRNADEIHPLIGFAHDLEALIRQHRIGKLIVATKEQRGCLPVGELVSLRTSGLSIEDAQSFLAELSGRVWLDIVRPSWFIFTSGFNRPQGLLLIKRIVDVIFSTIGLLLSAPIMAVVAVLVRLDSPGPVLYSQTRVGYRGKHFKVLKFRSMRTDAEISGPQMSIVGDPRITRIGKYLRKFRLDELPQFINVLRGEMSVIGPRPERPDFTRKLREAIPFYDERHSVRPGITGWAQVKYRYCTDFDDAFRKLEYDMFYLKNLSLRFDLYILLLTVRTVLMGAEWTEDRIEVPDFRPRQNTMAAAGD